MRRARLVLVFFFFAAFWTEHAGAVGTRTFELDTLDKLSGGDLKGTSVSSDGIVRAGWTLGSVSLPDASAVWCLAPLQDGSVLVGVTGGKVMRVAGDQASIFADTKTVGTTSSETAVTALVAGMGGAIYAATIPDGKIFKISTGKAEVFATLPDVNNIWALAYDVAKGALYAAVGPEGRVLRVGADGSSSVYFSTDEPNLVSLAVAPNGDLYAGSAGRGLLYRITGPGRASVVYDFPGDTATEVRAIAVAKSGALYVIDNEYGELPEVSKRTATSARVPTGPSTAARPKPGKGALYRFDAQDRPEKMMHHDEFHYMSLALDDAGSPYVGTGVEGRVYTVDDAHVVTLVADTDERQVGALLVGGGRKTAVSGWVASSDPSVIHRILGRGGPDSVWTSKPFDAGLRARFGHLTWRTSGPLEVSTRTGNTASPDATWSSWSPPLANAAPIPSPPARFVQVRARWSSNGGDGGAELSDIVVPFVTENVRPIVLEVGAQPRGSSHDSKEGIPASGGDPPRHDNVIKVTWKVDNPDNDQLRYRVAFRREGQNMWRDVVRPDEVLTKSEVDWDTGALPEGKYRVRVEASDEIANPPETVQKHALESPPVVVDNTPPIFRSLSLTQRRLRARISDGVGPIARVELTVDGKLEWRPLAAADGVFDSPDEEVDADVTSLVPPGSHIVAVRAFDEAGNSVTQEIESTP
jgi:hypothetical protein